MATPKLDKARRNKADEFYTQLSDIEAEVRHYKQKFKNKVVLCNCDDPYESNFFKYFAMNFNFLGLKKLIATCYAGSPVAGGEIPLFDIKGLGKKTKEQTKPHKIEITEVKDENADGAFDLADVEYLLKNKKNVLTLLEGDGDFRSDECIELLKEANIVVTNPPFSLFREYVAQLIKYKKKFLIIGNKNAIGYKEIFKLIKENGLWAGCRGFAGGMWFYTANDSNDYDRIIDGKKQKNTPSIWFTNLDFKKRHEDLVLYKRYKSEEYPHYDDFDAINVDKVAEIPYDWDGLMGVPITFLDKYNPDQFEIVDELKRYAILDTQGTNEIIRQKKSHACTIGGRDTYARIVIRRKGASQ